MGHAPENTIASFKKALELGCDEVETDVWLTQDGRLLITHDRPTAKTTLSLDEVLDFCRGRMAVNVEIKCEKDEARARETGARRRRRVSQARGQERRVRLELLVVRARRRAGRGARGPPRVPLLRLAGPSRAARERARPRALGAASRADLRDAGPDPRGARGVAQREHVDRERCRRRSRRSATGRSTGSCPTSPSACRRSSLARTWPRSKGRSFSPTSPGTRSSWRRHSSSTPTFWCGACSTRSSRASRGVSRWRSSRAMPSSSLARAYDPELIQWLEESYLTFHRRMRRFLERQAMLLRCLRQSARADAQACRALRAILAPADRRDGPGPRHRCDRAAPPREELRPVARIHPRDAGPPAATPSRRSGRPSSRTPRMPTEFGRISLGYRDLAPLRA